jgi:hypothetical protein
MLSGIKLERAQRAGCRGAGVEVVRQRGGSGGSGGRCVAAGAHKRVLRFAQLVLNAKQHTPLLRARAVAKKIYDEDVIKL